MPHSIKLFIEMTLQNNVKMDEIQLLFNLLTVNINSSLLSNASRIKKVSSPWD